MATRDDLNKLKTDLKDAIAAETAQVTAEIQALKDQLSRGEPITADDLNDLTAAIDGVKNIDPDAV